MESNNKEKISIIPLLAVPILMSIGLQFLKPSGRTYPSPTSAIRTETEQRDLKLEGLEDTIDGLGMDYRSFMEVAGFKRTLPVEYDTWKVSVDVNDNWINRGNQSAVDYNEDGLGEYVQIDLSERDAQRILAKK